MLKNQWTGIGRITKDLDLRVTESGKKVLNFDIAIDDGRKDAPHTTYLPIEVWEKTAETIAKHFHKGDQIIISGHLGMKKYVDRGENRYKVAIILDSFEWGARKKEEDFSPVQNYTADDVSDFDVPWAD